jgi:hypothetical protein
VIRKRPAEERGHADHGWLDTYHTFSFADYHSPEHMGFRTLRVLNDDTVTPGAGFGTHGHRDMEIVSYVLEGALEHRDSMGSGSVLRPGDVQRMTAGTGVTHSEFNHSKTEPLRFLQIWILPAERGLTPEYEEKHFAVDSRHGRLCLVASPDGAGASLRIHQDVKIYTGLLGHNQELSHTLARGRHAWLQVANGEISLETHRLGRGDGAAVSDDPQLHIVARRPSEFLLLDLG